MSKRFLPTLIAIALAVFAISIVVLSPADDASAAGGDGGWVDHPGLVPGTPEGGYPIIQDSVVGGLRRQTLAVDLIGNYIISGGDFLSIELQDGSIISQPNLAIVDWRTKELVCTDLDVDDEVLSIAPGPRDNTAIIGGRFDLVNGADGVDRTRNKIALIDMETCLVDKTWIVSNLNGRVTELAVRNDRLFIGGDFTQIDGMPIERLAEINLTTTTLNPSFDFVFDGELSRAIVGMEVSPDGSRLGIVHRASSIDGQLLRGTAIFDISNPGVPFLTNHRMSTAANSYTNYNDIQDGAISPDFSRIGIANGTATISDYVAVIPTTEAAGQLSWQHFMRDSSFGIAMTNDIVYVSGHFCKIDSGPGATDLMAPNSGPSTCTGSNMAGGVWRTQLAALDIDTGTPLTWNPGNDSFVGGRAVTVVNRGLLVGFDGDRSDNIRTGTTAFYDFGAPDDPRTDQTCSAMLDGLDVNVSWDPVPGVTSYIVRRNNSWVASPGNVTAYTDAPPAGEHTYYIRTFLDEVEWTTTCAPTVTVDTPGGFQTCTATLVGDDSINLSYTAIPGEDSYNIRRNGSFVANTGAALTYAEIPGEGVFTYVVRSRINGVTTNTTCTPTITIDLPDPPAQTCAAIDNGDGTVTLTWDAIDGEDKYTVRRNNVWLVSLTNGELSHVAPNHTAGDTYVIRSRMAGVVTNTSCV